MATGSWSEGMLAFQPDSIRGESVRGHNGRGPPRPGTTPCSLWPPFTEGLHTLHPLVSLLM